MSKNLIQAKAYWLAEFIKNIHNQQTTHISDNLQNALNCSSSKIAIIKLLNIQINSTLQGLPSLNHIQKQQEQVYFENQEFVISKQLRRIGQIVKIVGKFLHFQDLKERDLSQFQTKSFFEQIQKERHYNFIDFLKGIFPKMNVHKNNIPLYMPFYTKLSSYNLMQVGNPNWEMSRYSLDLIYKSEILKQNQQQERWYLMLTGDKKICQKFDQNNYQKIWSYLYYFYQRQTLQPYRLSSSSLVQDNKITITFIKSLIQQKLVQELTSQMRLLLILVLYLLSDSYQDLKRAFQQFVQNFQMQRGAERLQKNQLSIYGLINAQFSQIFRNLKEQFNLQEGNSEIKKENLKSLSDKSLQISLNLTDLQIPYYDFYLRVAFPVNQHGLKENDQKLLQILNKEMQKRMDFEFPQYPFENEVYRCLSSSYFNKYPQKLIQVAQFLPIEISVWKLLSCLQLNEYGQFLKIQNLMKNKQKQYLEGINKTVRANQKDYNNFLRVWEKYHQIFSLNQRNYQNQFENRNSMYQKVNRSKELINQIVNELPINQNFAQKIHLPFKDSLNVFKVLEFMIDGFQQTLIENSEKDNQELLQQYSTFILSPLFKNELSDKLSQNQKNEMWKKWSSVYLADQDLVQQLLGAKQNSVSNQSHSLDTEQKNILQNQMLKSNQNSKSNQMQAMELQ